MELIVIVAFLVVSRCEIGASGGADVVWCERFPSFLSVGVVFLSS